MGCGKKESEQINCGFFTLFVGLVNLSGADLKCLDNPILQHQEPWGWFTDSLCCLGGALRLEKHYLLQYIVIKLAPEGEETAAAEVDGCEIKSLYSVCAACLQLYMVKSASLGCTVTDTDINPCFSAPIYSCNIFISCVLCMSWSTSVSHAFTYLHVLSKWLQRKISVLSSVILFLST